MNDKLEPIRELYDRLDRTWRCAERSQRDITNDLEADRLEVVRLVCEWIEMCETGKGGSGHDAERILRAITRSDGDAG